MNDGAKAAVLTKLTESLEIPDSAYESAAKRYRDLGQWLHDESCARCAQFDPVVSSQGSFRLGTVVKPWKRDEYDLDLACGLQSGITKANMTQQELKLLLGADLENYRIERGVQDRLEEKHRCWRLNYQDSIRFHMDTVPCIPQSSDTLRVVHERMVTAGLAEDLAQSVAKLAVAITDNRHPQYTTKTADWFVSNPEGYARWFESRMRQARQLLEARAKTEVVASIEQLPTYRWKTPLQQCVQILKRHRDVMFERSREGKPISIIITTLAAKAYRGETNLNQALETVLGTMGNLVNPSAPRVPNPVNPAEDFADKWDTAEGRRLGLERNFLQWLEQAKADFETITTSGDKDFIAEQASRKFGANLDVHALAGITGTASGIVTSPTRYNIIEPQAAKPWCD